MPNDVAKGDRGTERSKSCKTRSIGELVLPGGPVREVRQVKPASKINPVKHKRQEGLKRTSVAVLKYNPGLAKSRQTDKRKGSSKKSSKDTGESPLWSSVHGGTEVYFTGHAIRHLQPQSHSSPDKRLGSKSSVTRPNQLQTKLQQHKPFSQHPAPWPQPRPLIKKSDPQQEDIKVYRGRWRCLQYLWDQICCQPQKKTTILYE
ncbi:uncharacterized protein LOC125485006 [Rhincodon typus]|uniref:uncharacterized protein LOC125485006 n=1 Tax=Rhincodon typus TaxID=259920 RepID=UPI00202E668E|nr:uncharacterized protein LOC125485006 [Rhincodon typus]